MNERWNLDVIYKGFDDPSFACDLQELKNAIAAFIALAENLKEKTPLEGLKEGTASFMVAYQTKLPSGQSYTLYTQPIVVEVGNFGTLSPKSDSGWQVKNGLLTRVETRLQASDLAERIEDSKYVQIFDEAEEFLAPESPVCTGTLISLYGDVTTVVVKGDLNGDGVCNAIDYILLKRYTAGNELEKLQIAAADMNGDGQVRSADYILMKRYALANTDAEN